jgi:hypothetical protein
MRCALGFFLFDMVFRSLITLSPYQQQWRKELEMPRLPLRLSTQAQREKIRQGRDEKYTSVWARNLATIRSAALYASPWPRTKTSRHLDSPAAYAKYAYVWLGTRLGFVGTLLGLDEDWPMFSPNVRRSHVAPRAVLVYADGHREQLWLLGEPRDPTHFQRWFVKRPLQIDLRLAKDYDARLSVSRNLAEHHPSSKSGAPLEAIEMFEVKYTLPAPGQDAREVLGAQAQKAPAGKAFWRFDVETGKGRTFDAKKRKAKHPKTNERLVRGDAPALSQGESDGATAEGDEDSNAAEVSP